MKKRLLFYGLLKTVFIMASITVFVFAPFRAASSFALAAGNSRARIPANDNVVKLPADLRICICDSMRTAEINIASSFSMTIHDSSGKTVRTISGTGLDLRVESVEKSLPAVIEYYSVLKTIPYSYFFNADKKNSAEVTVRDLEKKFGSLDFLTYGAVLKPARGNFTIDNRSLFLAKGKFSSEEEARLFCNRALEENAVASFAHPVRRSGPGYKIRISVRYSGKNVAKPQKDTIYVTGSIGIGFSGEAVVKDVEFGRGEKWHKFRQSRYSGGLEISPDQHGTVQIVNTVALDTLLRIVVPSEIEAKSPYQAICAQAVAARSEILSKLKTRHTESDYDFCAGTHCQAFAGLSNSTDESDRAVRETSGLIVVSGGGIVDTVYHANCGGLTECSNRIWSAPYDPALIKVSDALDSSETDLSVSEEALKNFIEKPPATYCSVPGACDNPDKFRWTRRLTIEEIDGLVSKQFQIGSLREIKVLSRGASGRIFGIELIGEKSSARLYKELPIRKLFGMIRSALFFVTTEGSGKNRVFVFHGAGWGHGVGLCQDGAKGMAISGKKYDQILLHYYSQSRVVKID